MHYDPLRRWDWEGGAVPLEEDVPADSEDGDDRSRNGERDVVDAETA